MILTRLRNGFLQATHKASVLSMTFTGSKDVQLTIGTGPDHGIFDVHIGGSLWQSIDGYAPTAGQRVIAIPVTRTEARTLEIRSRADKNRGSSGYVVRFKQLSVAASYVERTIDYAYDALSRLTEADYGSTTYTYGYDLAGNLTNKNGTMRTFNAGNQMTSDGTNTLTYDSNGNLTNDGTNSYTWDRANRMLTAPGGTAYQYDGLGNRVSQTVNSVVTSYLLDMQPGLTKVLAATTGTNTERYVHGPGGIHATESASGEWSSMLQDGLGSVRGVVDDGLRVDAVQSYDPYGQPDGNYGAGYGFTGEQTDGNGQVYLRARYYDPGLGVFASLDPFEGTMQRPMSLNGYSWVEGNPIVRTDPRGLAPLCQTELSCPDAAQFVPPGNPNRAEIDTSFFDESDVPAIGGILSTLEDIDIPVIEFGVWDAVFPIPLFVLDGVIEAARLGGNYRAARNMRHFFNSGGTPITDYDVDAMINDLDEFRKDIKAITRREASALLNPVVAPTPAPPTSNPIPSHCQLLMTVTEWRRLGHNDSGVGQDTAHDVYPNVKFDLEGHPELALQFFNSPSREFDWFIAQNAFWYSMGISVVMNSKNRSVKVCRRVFFEDYFAWYINEGTQTVDAGMAALDAAGIGANYPMSGTSSIECENFRLQSGSGAMVLVSE